MVTLFEKEMKNWGVKPLNAPDFLPIQKHPPKTRFLLPQQNSQHLNLKIAPWRDFANEHFPCSFAKNGIARHSFKALKNIRHVDDAIDLHGYTVDQARSVLFEFLKTAQATHARRVLVIHGKGREENGRIGILKTMTFGWLFQAENVLAYHNPAPISLGNAGATVVLLKKKSTVND